MKYNLFSTKTFSLLSNSNMYNTRDKKNPSFLKDLKFIFDLQNLEDN